MDFDALSIVKKLQQAGYLSYFVGGCVRDVLIGKTTPKDFDVVTEARPQDVRRVFRYAQLIGRRFKLAHVHCSNGKTIEVATFRRPPLGKSVEDGLIVDDNEYGTPETDAFRRDFTINALFYDPIREEIIDYVGGLKDINDRLVRSIGDPIKRFREDPIRMLRAIKFAARLNLTYDDQVAAAITAERTSLTMAARPRLQLELIRFLQGGEAERSYQLLHEANFLRIMIPELESLFHSIEGSRARFNELLKQHDQETLNENLWGLVAKEESILSLIFWPLISHLLLGDKFHESQVGDGVLELRGGLPRARDLKTIIIRLMAPIAARVGISIKSLHTIAKILATHILVELESSAYRDADQHLAQQRIREQLKGSHIYEAMLLMKIRHLAGQLSDLIWDATQPIWDRKYQQILKSKRNNRPHRRMLIPKKPVIKPTERRRRRKR